MTFADVINFLDSVISNELGASILLIVLVICLRWLALRYINNDEDLSPELRLRWSNLARNLILVFTLFALMVIWAPALRSLALSLTAFAVAMVIATKELLLCVLGSFVRAGGRNFYVGDLIEFQGYTGYVVDQSLLTTTLSEVGADAIDPSGRVMTFPNSLFLNTPVRNLSRLRPYSIYSFTFTLEAAMAAHIPEIKQAVEEVLHRDWNLIQEEKEFKRLVKSKQIVPRQTAPQVRIVTTDLGKIRLLISMLCRFDARIEMEQDIVQKIWAIVAVRQVEAGARQEADSAAAK